MRKAKGMVDITEKDVVYREAIAVGWIKLKKETLEKIKRGEVPKGDVLAVSRVAAVQAVKKTSELIPYCHPIPITSVEVEFQLGEETVTVEVTVKAHARTGVEMEALVGVCTALLTIWDMVKALEKSEDGQYPHTEIGGVKVLKKVKLAEGGKKER